VDPFWFHAANVVLHIVVSLLALPACRAALGRPAPWRQGVESAPYDEDSTDMAATMAALLFAVHPVST